jgi:glycosyltransferase involved in cell wall biosynthesis
MTNLETPEPTVTFIVPSYRLAQFLQESVSSILSQSFKDLEILIMDDRSPDHTANVARRLIAAHPGRQISYILNPENLGNIRNYNKGIQAARGKYVWILSPDDRLRSERIVEKYVQLMELHADVGYVFCPGHTLDVDRDMGLYQNSVYRQDDEIIDGLQVVRDIADNNFEMLSPSVMIRKKCYEEITLFPEDMPHRGDSYVWALIAMQYKVGYFAEAMVDYRVHRDSMMSQLARERSARIVDDDIRVPWRIRTEAARRGLGEIARYCEGSIAKTYTRAVSGIECRGCTVQLPLATFEASLQSFESDPGTRARIRRQVFDAYGDRLYWRKALPEALDAYRQASAACGGRVSRAKLNVMAKMALIKCGRPGDLVRSSLGRARRLVGAVMTGVVGQAAA